MRFLRYAAILMLFVAFPAVAQSPVTTVVRYVATNGNASWHGTLPQPNANNSDGPFATIEQARAYLASLHIAKNVAKYANTNFVIEIEQGTYTLSGAENFTKDDSGTPTTLITYKNYGGDQPVISGGRPVTGWMPKPGAANVWQTTLNPVGDGYVQFENLWVNETRHLRPQLTPDGYNRIYKTVFVGPNAQNPSDVNCSKKHDNSTHLECFDRFAYNLNPTAPNDPTALSPETWGNVVPATGGACNWNVVNNDIEVLVFEQFSTSKLRVKCINTRKGIVFMTGPTAIPPPANTREAGFITGDRIVIENVQSALGKPGQWFLDRTQSPWVLTYVGAKREDPRNEEIIIPQSKQLIVATDLQYVTFSGLTFEYDNYVVPDAGHVSSELEPEVTSALSFQNSQHITLDGIVVRHTSGGGVDFTSCLKRYDQGTNPASPSWCVHVDPTATISDIKIANSAFYDLGVHGIRIGYNSHGVLDKLFDNANSPHGVKVLNNIVEGYGQVIPAAFGIGQGVGHDNLYQNNEVYDGYHVAISISHGGNSAAKPTGMGEANNTIADNKVYNLDQGIMNDGGSIRIEAGNDVYTAPGNKITGNIIHDTSDASSLDTGQYGRTGYGGNGIYLDNSTGLVDVENNLVYRVSDIAVYSPHGPAANGEANTIKNNILAYARHGMIAVHDPYKSQSGPSYTPGQVFVVENNVLYFDRTSASTPEFYAVAGCAFPGASVSDKPFPHAVPLPYTSFELFKSNLYWRVPDGLFEKDKNAFRVEHLFLNSEPNPIPHPPPPRPAAEPQSADDSADDTVIDDPCGAGHLNMGSELQTAYFSFKDWQREEGEDNGSVVQDPVFKTANPQIDGDFLLPNGVPAVGFQFFPLTAGRQGTGLIQPPPVPATFMIQPFTASEF